MSLSKQQPTLLVIAGPTATGKTEAAIRVAQHFSTEIISADSRQIYKEMRIGTARPSPEQLIAVQHHFIASQSIAAGYSAGQFEADALALLIKLFEKHQVVVATGGTGLYLKVLCEGLDMLPEVPEALKLALREKYDSGGMEWLRKEVARLDPDYFETVDQANPNRLLRALEVCLASGKPFSSFRKKQAANRPFRCIHVALDLPREVLYQRINQRVDDMIAAGLVEEARALVPYRHLPAADTVGYRELFRYFDGEWTLDEAIARIKQHTRHYARRQFTWFRNQGHFTWWDALDTDGLIRWLEKEIS